MSRVALVVGVGPLLGAAIARRFARAGFRLALVARSPDFIGQLARELSSLGEPALALAADAGQPAELVAAIARARVELGPTNAGAQREFVFRRWIARNQRDAVRGNMAHRGPGRFRLRAGNRARLIAAGAGAIIFTGATSSVRGGGWLAFSSAKFALRGLAQSLARELWPQGIHVAHVVVDGLIGPNESKETLEPMLAPDRMADAYFQLTEQDRSAWTLELDLRPHRERFFE